MSYVVGLRFGEDKQKKIRLNSVPTLFSTTFFLAVSTVLHDHGKFLRHEVVTLC